MAVVSVVDLSELGDTMRTDAEYYQPRYLKLEGVVLKTKSYRLWGQVKGQFITGPFGSEFIVERYVEDSPYRYVRGRDVKEFFLLDDDNVYIPEKDFARLKKYALRIGDILVSVVGTLGNAAVVDENTLPAIFSCKSTLFHSQSLNPLYLIAYLNSKYGRSFLERKVRGAVQTGLNIDDLRSTPIFIPDKSEEEKIAGVVQEAKKSYDLSKSFYFQAEKLLLWELGLKDFKPKYEFAYTATLSKTFEIHRIDAEYYQPAYEEVIEKVLNYQNGYAKLLSYAGSIKPDFDPSKHPDKPFSYVELADIDASIGVIQSASEIKGEEAPSRARRILRKDDVIVSSVEGSLEKVALVSKEHEGSLASTGFFQFRPKRILPESLLVLSKSPALQMQLKKECAGTILTAVPNESLKRILVPVIPSKIQQKIALLVQQSHEARAKAKNLLKEAKIKVEKAIETRAS